MVFKIGNGTIETGNGIISPTSWPLIKKPSYYNIFSISTKEFKIDFQDRKWNYSNRKWNYFSYFQTCIQNFFFTKWKYSNKKWNYSSFFAFVPTGSKLIFKSESRIIKTGNGIIFPTSRPPIKNLLLQNASHLFPWVKNDFQNRKCNYPKCKRNYFSYF